MRLKHLAWTATLLTPLTLVSPGAATEEKHDHDQEHHQHDAHVHGIATLNLALEGEEVHIEFHSPAANIVGSEHVPSSEADHAVLNQAVARLKNGDPLFHFNDEAGCRMKKQWSLRTCLRMSIAIMKRMDTRNTRLKPPQTSRRPITLSAPSLTS